MAAITATVRSHYRSLVVVAAIAAIAIAIAVISLVLFVTSPAHDMQHVVSTYHHLPHFLQAFLGAQHLGA